MTELHWETRLAGFFCTMALCFVGVYFFRQQNQSDALGGQISRAKCLWLLFALLNWFFLPLLLTLDSHVIVPSRTLFGIFSFLMWMRGIVEYVMLYWTKNWRPPLGITHDIICIVCLCGGLWYSRNDFQNLITTPFQQWIYSFFWMLIFSLCVEVLYAVLFFKAVQGKTTGEDGIWFASEEDPKFLRINRLTFFFNSCFYGYLLLFVWNVWL